MESKILTKEQFQEKFEIKREKLLEQKKESIEKEIAIILQWIDVKILTDEDKQLAKSLAEKKHYSEDDKLAILENIKNAAIDYWDRSDWTEWLNIFSDVTNDIVYQRMVEKWDIENIKLLLERKLPIDTYYQYLFVGKILKDDNWEKKLEGKNWWDKSEIQLKIHDKIAGYSYHGIKITEKELKNKSLSEAIKYKIYRNSWISVKWWSSKDIDEVVEIDGIDKEKFQWWDEVIVNCYYKWTNSFICKINIKIIGVANDNSEWNEHSNGETVIETATQDNDIIEEADTAEIIPSSIINEYIDACTYIVKVDNLISQIRSPLQNIEMTHWNIIDRLWESVQSNVRLSEEEYRKAVATLKDDKYYKCRERKQEIEMRYPNIVEVIKKWVAL